MNSNFERLPTEAFQLLEEAGGCTYKWRREGLALGEQRRCPDGEHIWTPPLLVFYFILRGCVVCGLIDRATVRLAREAEMTETPQGMELCYPPTGPGTCVVCGRLIEHGWKQVCGRECATKWLGQHFIIFAERQRLMPRDVAVIYQRHCAGRELTGAEEARYER